MGLTVILFADDDDDNDYSIADQATVTKLGTEPYRLSLCFWDRKIKYNAIKCKKKVSFGSSTEKLKRGKEDRRPRITWREDMIYATWDEICQTAMNRREWRIWTRPML